MDAARDWSFARRPRWIVGHVLAVVLILVCVVAGAWQWSRHREVSARNDEIEARRDDAPMDESRLRASADAEWSTVTLQGTWDPEDQVTIANRSQEGAPGCHVVTPLVLDAGDAMLVNRGFLVLADCDEEGARAVAPPASGPVTVTGLVRASQTKGFFGATDPAEGVLRRLQRVDVGRIDQQYERDLLGGYVELASQNPAAAEPPFPIPPPTLDDGPHLSYTVQWFLFALVGAIGYPLVLRHQAQRPSSARHRSARHRSAGRRSAGHPSTAAERQEPATEPAGPSARPRAPSP